MHGKGYVNTSERGGGEHNPRPPFLFHGEEQWGGGRGEGHNPRFQMAGVGDFKWGLGSGPVPAVSNVTMGKGKSMVHAYATDGRRIWSFQSHRDRDAWVEAAPETRRRLTEHEQKKHYNMIRRRSRDGGIGKVGMV